ncbi:MAG TPA: leucine--tRNA ligase, partial [Brevundimonas sp.]|nr:leucine--tRNA ligase [Brevundimonas sp.]
KKNVVDLDAFIEDFGADAARWFVLSDSPPERDVEYTAEGVDGVWRFIQRVWTLFDTHSPDAPPPGSPVPDVEGADLALRRSVHRAVKDVSAAIEGFRFNSAVASLHELVNDLRRHTPQGEASQAVRSEALGLLARMLVPFMPHLAESCWERASGTGLVVMQPWPDYDPGLVVANTVTLPVQVNGKRRGEITVPRGAPSDEVEA